jgi:thiol-disulfide isomerase/thioredoxin
VKGFGGKFTALAALAVVLVVIVFAGIVLAEEGGSEGRPAGGDEGAPASVNPPVAESPTPAPDLSGTDPITGREVSLADFAGKPVVVNIWASWCPGCNDEATDVRRFAAAHPEAAVVGLDFQDSVSGAKSFYRRWGWQHASIFDAAGTKTAALGLLGLPTTVFLDAEHRIVGRIVGASDLAGFEQGLELAERAS